MVQENPIRRSGQKSTLWRNLGRQYFVKTPWWLKKLYPSYTWNIQTDEQVIYLTFDDGPHEQATAFALDILKKYGAHATFFCIGKNVARYPALYQRILEEGHAVGNHTFNHLNGWNTPRQEYLDDVARASRYIDSCLFRPPYGRIRSSQARNIPVAVGTAAAKVVMWDVLSGDFDDGVAPERCLRNVLLNAKRGSIVVFHDSEKAFHHLEFCLPRVLKLLGEKGFRFGALSKEVIDGR